MDKRKHYLAFMIGLAVALSLSAVSTRSNVLQGIAAPLIHPTGREYSAETVDSGYSITWFTIDGGGGTGSGGSYELKYTIGQPDASRPEGSPFTRHGGFWAGVIQFWNNFLPITLR